MTAEQILQSIFPLSIESEKLLMEAITEVRLPKGHVLLHPDRVEPSIYLVKKGMLRAYADVQEAEVTFWFGAEGEVVLSMRNYVENRPSYESIELLEDSILYELKTDILKQLFNENIEIANWGRKLAETELVKTEERLINRQVKSASDRYAELLRETPQLLQRVQLGYIASYLGITQVSLSRIRAEKK